jgi:hypothetical protein
MLTQATEPPPSPPDTAAPPAGGAPAAGLSSWITYVKPDCCGPIGGDGSIHTELYATTGPTLPVGGTNLSAFLDTGWAMQAGGRALFFNAAEDIAWTIDLSISDYYNHAKPGNSTILNIVTASSPFSPAALVPTPLEMRDLNRTFANAAIGREFFFNVPATANQFRIRGGMDIGYRFGTAKAEWAQISHTTDTIYGLEIGWHTDLEIPRGCCTWYLGFRGEWDYCWMGILQPQHNRDLQDITLMLTFGVRF